MVGGVPERVGSLSPLLALDVGHGKEHYTDGWGERSEKRERKSSINMLCHHQLLKGIPCSENTVGCCLEIKLNCCPLREVGTVREECCVAV